MSYTAIVLEKHSQRRLENAFGSRALARGCNKYIGHHVTLAMGGKSSKFNVGDQRSFTVTHTGFIDGRVYAVRVDGCDDSENRTPHITVAVGDNAKPVESNNIIEWTKIPGDGFVLFGTVEICK